jgi:hypothetical protein
VQQPRARSTLIIMPKRARIFFSEEQKNSLYQGSLRRWFISSIQINHTTCPRSTPHTVPTNQLHPAHATHANDATTSPPPCDRFRPFSASVPAPFCSRRAAGTGTGTDTDALSQPHKEVW